MAVKTNQGPTLPAKSNTKSSLLVRSVREKEEFNDIKRQALFCFGYPMLHIYVFLQGDAEPYHRGFYCDGKNIGKTQSFHV
jgi:hypothetical protein